MKKEDVTKRALKWMKYGNLKNELYDMSKAQLISLTKDFAGTLSKEDLSSFLSEIPPHKLVGFLNKGTKYTKLLHNLLNEPAKESEMRRPVKNWLMKDKKFVAVDYEVNLPSMISDKRTQRKIDVAGYKKKMGTNIYAVELKNKVSLKEVDSAFSQAKDYKNYCEYSAVCFSPLMFLKYADKINQKNKNYREIGILVANKGYVIKELYPAPKGNVPDNKQKEMQAQILRGGGQ